MTLASRERLRAAGVHCGAWFAYAALAVVLTWPLATHLSDRVLAAPYWWDALTNTMILGTRVHNALGIGAGGPYDAYFFAPIPNTIAFNENLFGLSILFAPIYLLTHEPILSYNLVLLWSLSLSGYFAFLLVRRVSGNATAGFLAGAAFAFCPYVVFELGRIQLVATQWLPMCLWFLHRALATRRWPDALGFALAFVLQVGTCLYYALFLLPILALVVAYALINARQARVALLARLTVAGALAAALIVPMILPYFSVREHFDLTRDEDYAQGFDGKLSFFGNVHTTNRVWGVLRHRFVGAGAHEEIAFPGLVIALLCLFALLHPTAQVLRKCEPVLRRRLIAGLSFSVVVAGIAAFGATAATGTLLGAAVALLVAYAYWRSLAGDLVFVPQPAALYLVATLLSIGLFLGIEPMRVNHEPVHGLYYYLFTYVPGFDGIRKVSRQAIIVMLMLSVLGGIGAAGLLAAIERARVRHLVGAALALLIVLETYSAPMALESVPAGAGVPDIYHFIAQKKEPGPIAVLPARDGRRLYRGHPGQAVHNYESLYHRHRTINGKSSWIPPVTRLFDEYMNRFPSASATRLLLALGARQLVVHAGDYGPERAQRISDYLDADSLHYERIARSGASSVYRIKPASDEEGWLLPLPKLPAGAQPIDRRRLRANAPINVKIAAAALDGDVQTTWSTLRTQRGGDWFELGVNDPAQVVAIDIAAQEHATEVPLSFEIQVGDQGPTPGPLRPVLLRPRVFFFEQQVYSPKDFIWRVVLPAPMTVGRVRIIVRESVPNQPWTIPEIILWAVPAKAAAQ